MPHKLSGVCKEMWCLYEGIGRARQVAVADVKGRASESDVVCRASVVFTWPLESITSHLTTTPLVYRQCDASPHSPIRHG